MHCTDPFLVFVYIRRENIGWHKQVPDVYVCTYVWSQEHAHNWVISWPHGHRPQSAYRPGAGHTVMVTSHTLSLYFQIRLLSANRAARIFLCQNTFTASSISCIIKTRFDNFNALLPPTPPKQTKFTSLEMYFFIVQNISTSSSSSFSL